MKHARGTYQPCRNSPAEPRGTPGVPDPPRGLDARERSEWAAIGERLAAMGVLQKEQVEVLELLVRRAKVAEQQASANDRRQKQFPGFHGGTSKGLQRARIGPISRVYPGAPGAQGNDPQTVRRVT